LTRLIVTALQKTPLKTLYKRNREEFESELAETLRKKDKEKQQLIEDFECKQRSM